MEIFFSKVYKDHNSIIEISNLKVMNNIDTETIREHG